MGDKRVTGALRCGRTWGRQDWVQITLREERKSKKCVEEPWRRTRERYSRLDWFMEREREPL